MAEQWRNRAAGLLIRQGVSMRTRGWDYLLEAVLLAAKEPLLAETALYSRIAAKYGVRQETVRLRCRESAAEASRRGLSDDEVLSAGELIARTAAQLRFGAD